MHHTTTGPGWISVLGTLANLGIIAGYVIVPFTVLAKLPLTRFVRVAGVFFFLCCALTHVHMAMDPDPGIWLTVNHLVQAVAVWCFVIGFARLVRAANSRRARGGDDPGGST